VFGLGYVGTVTAAGLAACGHDVVGVDVDPLKVDSISRGVSPVVEPGIEAMLAEGVASGRLRATSDPAEAIDRADISLLCVGTPSAPNGSTDLTYVKRAIVDIHAAMQYASPPPSGFHAVVMRSTVPPGTGREIVEPIFTGRLPDGWTVGTAMCPEFLREGSGVDDFFHPPFVVIGAEAAATQRLLTTLFAFVDQDPHIVSVGTAEGLKYACNAFHATKISFANEMGRIMRRYGVDAREMMRLFTQDTKLNVSAAYLRPGFAFGGSCLPKDLRALQQLARAAEVDLPLLAGTWATNDLVVRDATERVLATQAREVALLGLSFKMDTDDLRESPSVELAERLIGKGLDVRVYDPIVHPDRLVGANLRYVESKLPHLNRILTRTPQEALDDAGVAVVATSTPEAVQAVVRTSPALVLDVHGNLGSEVEALSGYEGIGW